MIQVLDKNGKSNESGGLTVYDKNGKVLLRDTSGSPQTLQEVTDNGKTTSNDIEFTTNQNSFVLTAPDGVTKLRWVAVDDGFGNYSLEYQIVV